MIAKLKKLKGRSVAEIVERGRQKAAALVERAGATSKGAEIDLLRSFGPERFRSAEELFRYFCTRKVLFFPSCIDRNATIAVLEDSFPDERDAIIRRAESILSGTYDLLGYQGLRFGDTTPDWHFDPVSGKRSQLRHWSQFDETDPTETGDKKVVWELNRHQYFLPLGRAYWITGDEAFAAVFVSHVDDWLRRNPPKLGVNWISSMEIAYRSISWIWAFHYFHGSPHFGPDVFAKMIEGLILNARHIERYLSTYSSPNTHLTGEALGLYLIGTFLRGFAGAGRWKSTGYEILISELGRQVREDGGYVEQATHYHRYTAEFYLTLAILRKVEGSPSDPVHERKLAKLLKFLMWMTQPNGETPLIGDEDGGRLHYPGGGIADIRETLAVGAAVLNDGQLKTVSGQCGAEVLWLMGPDGSKKFDELETVPVDESVQAFQQSGVYVIRSGWDRSSNFLAIDCGEHGFMNCGHAHADALAFVASFGGVPVFVDSGTYTYTADRTARDHFRSSSAHNCLTVNGHGSAEPNGPFSWKHWPDSKMLEWKCGDAGVIFRGTHNGYERFGVRYEREFQVRKNGEITLVDKIKNAETNQFALSFVLSPLIEAEIRDNECVSLLTKEGKREVLAIVTKVIEKIPGESGVWGAEQTQISPVYGMLVPATKLIFSLNRNSDFEVENRFVLPDAE